MLKIISALATAGVVIATTTGAAGAMPRVSAAVAMMAGPAPVVDVGLGYKCKGPYVWQKYVPKRHPNYEKRYYNPFLGPPCRIGIYHGHGRGVVGTRVGDPLYRPHAPYWVWRRR